MGHIAISYADALARYPDQVQEVLGKLRKGRSKHKNDGPETLEWEIAYSEMIKVYSFAEILQRTQKPEPELTIEQKLAELHDSVRATLVAKKGKGYWDSGVMPTVPQEIVNERLALLEEDAAELAEISALAPEEQQKRLEDTLRQLRGPGFLEIRFPIPRG